MADQTIPPALAPGEWADGRVRLQFNPSDPEDQLLADVGSYGMEIDGWEIPPAKRHGLAALCLYGQPFGFTQEDVAELRDVAESWEQEAAISDEHQGGAGARDDDRGMWGKNAEACRRRAAINRSIADRLAALLPPLG
jgi:hypothetical protein